MQGLAARIRWRDALVYLLPLSQGSQLKDLCTIEKSLLRVTLQLSLLFSFFLELTTGITIFEEKSPSLYRSIKSSSLFSGNNVPLRGLTKMRNHGSRWSVREPHRERKIRKDYAFRESSNEAQPPVTSKSIKMTRGEDAYTPRHPNILTLEG